MFLCVLCLLCHFYQFFCSHFIFSLIVRQSSQPQISLTHLFLLQENECILCLGVGLVKQWDTHLKVQPAESMEPVGAAALEMSQTLFIHTGVFESDFWGLVGVRNHMTAWMVSKHLFSLVIKWKSQVVVLLLNTEQHMKKIKHKKQ